MAASQTDLSESVSAAKTDLKSEDVTCLNEPKEDQKTNTQSVDSKEHGSDSTYHENPKQDPQNASMLDKEKTEPGDKLTSKDKEETPMQIDDVESKSLSEVHDTKASIDHGSDDSKLVGDNDDKTKQEDTCGTAKQEESGETNVGLSSETTKEEANVDMGTADVSSKNTESKEAVDDANKNSDGNQSEKEASENPKVNPAEILDGDTERKKNDIVEKDSESSGDKGEDTAPDKDDGKASDIKKVVTVSTDDNAGTTASKEVGGINKDAGEAAETEAIEIADNKGADDIMDVAGEKENVCVQEDTAATSDTKATECSKDSKTEDDKQPDPEPEEPPAPKMPNGVSLKGKGRRKGNPKRAVPDDTPEPSTSAAETRGTRAQPAKKESAQPPSKKRKASEEHRSQPTRRSKRRKFHGWGAKRKTRAPRDQ